MNLNEFATSLGYSSREREDGSFSWFDQEDNRMNEGLDSLRDSFNDFNRFDSQGRPIFGTSAVLPGKTGSAFRDGSGQTRYRLGSDSLTDQLRSVGAQENDLQYDPTYGYHIPQKLQDDWSGAFQQPSMMENFKSNSPLILAGIAGGAIAGGAFGGLEGGVNLGGLDGALGDSFLSQPWMNGAETLGNFSQSFSLPGTNSAFDLGNNSMFDDVFSFAENFNTGGVDFANSPSQFQNPFANPGEGLTTNLFGDSLQNFGSSLNFPTSYTGNMAGAALPGQAVPGGDLFSSFKDFLTKPQIPGLSNSTGANGASSLINYLIKQQQAETLREGAERSATLNNPMNQPQRFPFQAAYTSLMGNPNSYFQTPYAVGQQNLANQAFQANVSKFGPSGTGFDQYLKNFQNIQSNDFFKLADQLSTAGGFNQGTGGAGNSFAQLAGPSATAALGSFEGFGKLLSDAQPQPGYSPKQNPVSGATQIFS